MNNPLVSILVLTYKQEKTISETLESIISQKTKYSFEIIIGEDCSNDRTREICENYASQYPNITLMPSAPNKGLMLNYLDCYKAAKGKYIMGCAGDDFWPNELKIEKQVKFLEEHPDYVFVCGQTKHLNVMNGSVRVENVKPFKNNLFRQLMIEKMFFTVGTMCFRKEALPLNVFNSFLEKGYVCEDYPMVLWLAKQGKAHIFNDVFLAHRFYAGSISNADTFEKRISFVKALCDIRDDFMKLYPNEVSQQELDDSLYRSYYANSVKYNKRSLAIEYLQKIKQKSLRDWAILWLCKTEIGYSLLRRAIRSLIVT